MNEWAKAAAQEILIRIERLSRFVPVDEASFRLPPRSDERDVVERNLEVISEASRRLPDDLKAARTQIDWRVLADLGNVLRHAYHRVEETRLIEIVVDHLPALELAVQAILADLEAE